MMKKLMLLFLILLLSGCGMPAEPAVPTEPTVAETQEPTQPPFVDIGGTEVDVQTTELDLRAVAYNPEQLAAAAPRLENLTAIELGETDLSFEQVRQIQLAFPNAAVHYALVFCGQPVSIETAELDLSRMQPEEVDALLAQLPLATGLRRISFIREDGSCVFPLEDIPVLDRFRERLPEVDFRVSFELFGQTVTSEDTRIEYYLVPIGNDGAETVRSVLPYLTACEYLLMDGCGVDNEVMAQLRNDFPDTKVVWRVWITEPNYDSKKMLRCAGFLTDTHRVRTTLVTDETADVLKYCTETKYVDFGHNSRISDFSFLGYMPKLEVAILSMTGCRDISMLANCPELEYLEIYENGVTDISALAACTKLKHLNISRIELADLTPIFGLELERLRCVMTNIPEEQLAEYARLHPDCQMMLDGWNPDDGGWRRDKHNRMVPRYELLQEQMEYVIDLWNGIP